MLFLVGSSHHPPLLPLHTTFGSMAQSQELSAAVGSPHSLGSVSRRPSVDRTSQGHFHPYLRQFSEGTSAAVCVQPRSPPFKPGPDLSSPNRDSWDCSTVQMPSKPYAASDQTYTSKYSPQNFFSACQESPPQFPKPIYSYSILIFMALKSSKTGSLPVSEIYSFMTEHFPYFKTAPDGWKNSVRHNLSLNKCFEKVENKNGSSSRKGCLWALNPSKVDKMQEELHKWRRKDPGTVRRSMAQPEDLDRLLGERPNKFRSLAPCAILPSQPHAYSSSSCYVPEQLRPPSSQHYPQSLYLSHSAPRPNHSFNPYSPCGQHVLAPHCLPSQGAGRNPPAYSVAHHEGQVGRGMQDLLMEGDTGCDLDTLSPSLTDLQLQGNLWEELKGDSSATVSGLVPSSEKSSFMSPLSPITEAMVVRDKTHYVDRDGERLWRLEQDSLNGHNLGQFSGVESVAIGLNSCTTPVSLM